MELPENIRLDAAAERACEDLMREGYCILPDVIAPDLIEGLGADLGARFEATPFCDGDFYGRRTKRFGSLLRLSTHAADLVMQPLVLKIARQVLGPWCDRILLNLTQAIAIHPGALAQYPHRDEDMWQGPKGELEYLLNVIFPLSPFTAENGATLLWPRSHGANRSREADRPGSAAQMKPGSALLFLGSTLHGGGANVSGAVRRGIIVSYCLGWLRSFENQSLLYPPEVACRFDLELAALIGYAQHRPNLGNVEGQCPSILLKGRSPDHLPAVDALRPDQAEALRQHVATQEAARAGLLGS